MPITTVGYMVCLSCSLRCVVSNLLGGFSFDIWVVVGELLKH